MSHILNTSICNINPGEGQWRPAGEGVMLVFCVSGKNRSTRFTVIRCLSCGQTKRFLNNPEHCLWVDRPEAQLENQVQPGE